MRLGWLAAVLLASQVPPAGQPPRPRPSAPGAISGRITDADGKPVAGIEVRTMRRMTLGGVSQIVSTGAPNVGVGVSDAEGEYVIADRNPGEYLVVAFTHGRALTPKSSLDTVRYFVIATKGIAPDQPVTPAFIESVRAKALPLEIVAGENRSVTLRIN